MLQCPYPIRLTPMWGKTMRQFSERFCSCRTQQEYTQVGIKIFRFFRTEGSNRFPDRWRIPTCEARHGNPIDSPMLQWEFEEKPRPHYNRPQSWCAWGFPPYKICRARKIYMASFPDRFHRDNAALLRCVSSFSYILSLVSCRADVLRRGFFQEKSLVKIETGVLRYAVPASRLFLCRDLCYTY